MSWLQSDLQKVEQPYVPPTWADGTDEEIIEALEKHYNGEIDIHDYWAVGDERTVSLSAMEATGVGETQAAQDITLVILNEGGKTLVNPINGITECAFIVGQKNTLATNGYINSSKSTSGGWGSCARRTWCNSIYKNAYPSTLVSIFKEFTHQCANNAGAATLIDINDYFSLASVWEIFGSAYSTNYSMESVNSQFEYYQTATNRTKRNNSGVTYWTKSPSSNSYYNYAYIMNNVDSSNSVSTAAANSALPIAPYGVI